MTWYYVYAIVPATMSLPTDENERAGIFGESLELVSDHQVAAVVGEGPDHFENPAPELILRHHQVVARLCERGAALPVQFGTLVSGTDRIASSLREKSEMLQSDLTQLAGKVELGVTIPIPAILDDSTDNTGSSTVSNASSGSDYMNRRFQEYQRENRRRSEAEAVRDELSSLLNTLLVDHSEEVLPRPDILFRGRYLVERSQSETFEYLVAKYREEKSGLEVVLVGPWPPYSFVSSGRMDLPGMFGAIST